MTSFLYWNIEIFYSSASEVAALKLESFDVFSQFIMVLFLEDCQFTVDLTSKHFPYKRKQEIRRRITDYGGTISYILNNKVCQNSFHYKVLSCSRCWSTCSYQSEKMFILFITWSSLVLGRKYLEASDATFNLLALNKYVNIFESWSTLWNIWS
jgi:hypothetical protein